MALYQPTKLIINQTQFETIKPGQWISIDGQTRGQFLGKTKAGVIVIRYQSGNFGAKKDTQSNHLLRQYAIINGAQ